MLKITRSRAHAGSRFAFSVYCDDTLIGMLNPGETGKFDLPEGDHDITVRSRWGTSKTRKIYEIERDVNMYCSTDLDGMRAFFTLPYITFLRDKYIKMEKVID